MILVDTTTVLPVFPVIIRINSIADIIINNVFWHENSVLENNVLFIHIASDSFAITVYSFRFRLLLPNNSIKLRPCILLFFKGAYK